MDVVNLLFSFQGRIGRGQFWLAILIFFIAALIVTVVDIALQSYYVSLAVAVIAYGPALMCVIAAGIKRLHDRNKRQLVAVGVLPGPAGRADGRQPRRGRNDPDRACRSLAS